MPFYDAMPNMMAGYTLRTDIVADLQEGDCRRTTMQYICPALQKVTAGYTLRAAPLDIVADCKAIITALTARVHIAIDLLSYRTVSV